MTSLTDEAIQQEIDDVSAFCADMDDEEDNSWIDLLAVNSSRNQSGINESLDVSATVLNELDENTKKDWLYPIQGYEKRDYQFNISRSTLFHNTLVILPTGLGKTFIASVTIYNFMRWFPQSKIVFMAPTRPLVNQQMSACYDVVGIPKEETAEMTGKTSNKKKRKEDWANKRVFFATPQVIQSDIREGIFPCNRIKLLVFDEAHKAKGEYAYCKVVQEIFQVNRNFRVLGLTATAGKSADIIQIIQNLLISKIEHRSESSIDVHRFTHKKKIDLVPVKLGAELQAIYNHFVEAAEPTISELRKSGNITTNQISKGYLVIQRKNLLDNRSIPHAQKTEALAHFSAAIGFYHSLEILQRHSVHLFLKSLRDDENRTNYKFFIARNFRLLKYVKELDEKYELVSPLAGLTNTSLPPDRQIDFGHPKFQILATKLKEYFDNNGSKVIIFCEYRDTTELINILLMKMKPLVKAAVLIGQGRTISQKKQLQIMNDFRENVTNTLVCTCVAEEGLDIGDVDLVICFDINTKNSVRFVQRIGRTARKRNGQVIVLATEGKELSMSKDLIYSKDQMNKSLSRNNDISKYLYKGPRLFPKDFNPDCIELRFIINNEVEEPEEPKNDKKKKGRKPTTRSKKLDVAAKNSKESITNYLKPVQSKSTISSVEEEVRNVAEQIVKINDEEVVVIDDEIEQPVNNNNFSIEEIIQKYKASIEELKKENGMIVSNYMSDYIENFVDKEILLMSNYLENLNTSPNEKYENFELEPGEIDLSLIKPAQNSPQKMSPIRVNLDQSMDVFKSPLKISEKPLNQKTPLISSPFPLNFAGFQNSSTPIRSNGLQNENSLRKSLSRFKASSINSPNVPEPQPVIKNKFDFLGIMSIEDIFEGCDSHFDYNSTSKLTEKVQNSPTIPDDVIECSQEEKKNERNFLKNLKISDINDIFDSSCEQQSMRNVQNNAEDENSNSSDKTQIYDVEEEIAKIEITNNSIIESSLSPQNGNDIGNDTQYYDVNEALAKLEESFENSQKENVRKIQTDSYLIKTETKPNLSKLKNFMQNSNKNTQMNILRNYNRETTIKEIEDIETQVLEEPINFEIENNETQIVDERCSTPTNQDIILSSNESTPDLAPNFKSRPNGQFLTSPVTTRLNLDSTSTPETVVKFKEPRKKTIRPRQRLHNSFLQTQAAADDTASSDEHHDELDGSLADFVCNDSVHDNTRMYAKYVKSLNSPSAARNGRFVLRQLQPANISDIYSQFPQAEEDQESDSDSMGSFIVEDEEHDVLSEIDELELAEQLLKEKRRKRRMKQDIDTNKKKRKIIMADSDSSDDEDELEKLRKEVFANPD